MNKWEKKEQTQAYFDDEEESVEGKQKSENPILTSLWYLLVVGLLAVGIACLPKMVARYMPETYDVLGGNGDRNYNVRGMTPGVLPQMEASEPKQVQSKQQAPIEKKANKQ